MRQAESLNHRVFNVSQFDSVSYRTDCKFEALAVGIFCSNKLRTAHDSAAFSVSAGFSRAVDG